MRSIATFTLISAPLLMILGALPFVAVAFSALNDVSKPTAIPITVLSGFLGSGKTTLLQHLLENQQGLRIAVVVNDVASVNIDSKLVSSSSPEKAMAAGMVELQNGCACCSLSEELLTSVSELVTLSDMRGDDEAFHHIVIELSGVADPKSVRAKFQEAVLYDMPLMERVCLDTMVTVVDCSVFLNHLASSRLATPDDSPGLFYRDGRKPPPREQEDWMNDIPKPLLEALLAGSGAPSPHMPETNSAVAELLVSQTETADVVLLNKVDLVDDETATERIKQVVNALNPRATLIPTTFGKVPLEEILGVAGGQGVVEAGVVDDHRDAVHAVDVKASTSEGAQEASPGTSHSHEHAHDHAARTDPSHDHSHSHHHEACNDPDCTDSSHSHHHSHDHVAENCDDPDCTDPLHDHSSHASSHAGISSFVFRARRPFHPKRLVGFLNHLPVVRGLPDRKDTDEINNDNKLKNVLKKVLRSKGFVWCADSNIAALYWSHSGSSFEMQCLGRWWATLPREHWPPEATATLLQDFDDPNHMEEADGSSLISTTVGDRRQEIVFIGAGLEQRKICDTLEQCLLTDDEWKVFQKEKRDETRLRATFANTLEARMATY